jgi:NAD(P)-dependent dehydrogenase (short-subunit alcohol dehydrogenase family)
MARIWARRGRDLALCARRVGELERLRDELLAGSPGLRITVHAVDVVDHDAVDQGFADAADEHGGLDRVVVNAGVAGGGSLGAGSEEGNRLTARTNFLGAVHQAEAAVRLFRTQGHGHLAFVSSMSALRGMGGAMNVYAATKAGVSALAEGLRSDLWDTDIRVTAVHPGYIGTGMVDDFHRPLFVADVQRGAASLVAAVERERPRAYVPAVPWAALALPMRLLPLGLYRRVAG